MKTSLMTEASITDSFIYGLFNASGEVQNRIMKALKEGKVLDKSFVEEQIIQIEKSRISPLMDRVLQAYYDGFIQLIYWESNTQKMTKSIPFIIHKSPKGAVVSIFVSSFGKLSADKLHLDMPMKSLYILMESAYIALNTQISPLNIRRNVTIMKICNEVYVNMFMRVLNRDYALSMDTQLHDKISYVISRFFLNTVWGLENKDIARNYALQVTTEKNSIVMDPVSTEFENRRIDTIDELFKFLKELSPRLSSLTVRYFIERFINTYGGPSVLSVDYLPYVLFVVINTVIGGFLLSQSTLSDIVHNTKDIRKFWAELSKIV